MSVLGRRTTCPLRRVVRVALFASTLLGGAVQGGVGQEALVPIERQAVLMSKIVQFDRRFVEGPASEVVLAVVYQRGFRTSLLAQEALTEIVEAHPTLGRKVVRVVSIELDEDRQLEQALRDSGAGVVYVAPLRAVGVGHIVQATRQLGILSFTGVPSYVSDGVSVGISMRGERVEILINLRASRLEGARLSSELLKLSRLVDEGGDHG